MNFDFMVVLENLMSLFLLMGAGFILVEGKVVQEGASKAFSTLLLKLTLPCTIFVSLAFREYDPSFARDSLLIIGIGLILYPLLLFLSGLAAGLFRIPRGRKGIWAFAGTFTNAGFMGFPIILMLFGPEGLALAVMLNITFNLYVYTIGAMAIAGDAGGQAEKPDVKRIVFSNINIALFFSVVFYFLQLPVPGVLKGAMNMLSAVTTPLSMIITGMALGTGSVRELITDKDSYTSAAYSLAVVPLVLLLAFKWIPLPNPIIGPILVVTFAMPAPSITTVLADQYHGNLPLAARIMFIQNVFGVISIPAICLLL